MTESYGWAHVIDQGQRFGPFLVESLSASEVDLRGRLPCQRGSRIATLLLDLPGRRRISTLVRLPLTRLNAETTGRFRLSLVGNGPRIQDEIQQVALEHLERESLQGRLQGRPAVVVLSRSEELVSRLRHDLAALGRRAIVFEGASDGIVWSVRTRSAFCVVMVDSDTIDAMGSDALGRMAEWWFDKRRILVQRRGSEAPAMAFGVAHGVLEMPWTRTAFETALGLTRQTRRPGLRVLFVDDEALLLAAMQTRMRRHFGDCETVWTTSGSTALAELRAKPFDVVVTDLRMPGLDGIDLLTTVRDESPATRRIVLTGYGDMSVWSVADLVLNKPCSPETMRDVIFGLQ